ncbi:MAG: phosphate/phosphite/phosphonate ABC transporter substrate-binding protein [Gammaproteobacteria bacterium]|jgi:phosphonate transport system substrate-binding protein|nr:phosphate/phosphite/phosphonate ABC transporter substrate-binding protein [Gammaproteobacteria bacterium]
MLRILLSTVAALWLMVAVPLSAQPESIKLAVTDLVGLEELQREFGPFKAELEKATGYRVEFLPVTNRTAALEALRFKKVDFVLAGPAEYVVMKKRAQADVVVGLYRPDYFSMIVVKADSPNFTMKDLKGKPMGMGSVGSTSRHLGPMQLLAQAGLNPLSDLKVTHTNVNVAWEALKKGDLDAVGMGRSDYESLLAKEAEKQGAQRNAFRTLARSGDLPNDLLMVGAHVSPEVVKKVRESIATNSDALIAAILQGADHTKRYKGMRFLTQIADKDYDPVRTMYATAGYPEYSDFIGDK